MIMPRWLAMRLIMRALPNPFSHIYGVDGSVYMERFWLVPWEAYEKFSWRRDPFKRLLQKLGVAVRVHHIVREDRDRHLHNHPWPFLSIVLLGAYVEERPLRGDGEFVTSSAEPDTELTTCYDRNTGSIAFRSATNRHRIAMLAGDVWTLFITFGGKRQIWGFQTDEGCINRWTYEARREKECAKS